DGDDHGVGAPAVQLAEDAERGHIAQRQHVVIGVLQRRPVVEHQQHAGDGLDQEQEKGDAAHAPGVAQVDAALAHRHRVQVQEDVGQHHDDAVAPVARRRVAEDALPDLRAADVVADWHGGSFVKRHRTDRTYRTYKSYLSYKVLYSRPF